MLSPTGTVSRASAKGSVGVDVGGSLVGVDRVVVVVVVVVG